MFIKITYDFKVETMNQMNQKRKTFQDRYEKVNHVKEKCSKEIEMSKNKRNHWKQKEK